MSRVLSLGAGVQSTTVLLMACAGEIQPFDVAIFADTQWEPAAVYAHLAWLEQKSDIPIHRVSAGSLRQDAWGAKSSAWMPLHIRGLDGKPGMLRRQCTTNYKIMPIRREIRRLFGAGRKVPVEMSIGISLDEVQRMRDSDVQYVTNAYPLIDLRMTRHDCLRWLASRGMPQPPKSSCIGCPYHDARYWRTMRDTQPIEWADAVEFDHRVRSVGFAHGDAFLHRSLVPLELVDLSNELDHGQMEMFAEECGGYCGH